MSKTIEAVESPVNKMSINKYDPYQLKGTLDDEIVYVRTLAFVNNYDSSLSREVSKRTINGQT